MELEKSGEEQRNVFSADSDLQLWPISDASSCIIGPRDGYVYMEICQPCKWVKTEAGISGICVFHSPIWIFFSVIEMTSCTRSGQKKQQQKKNHSLYVTLKARAKRKGKSVVQQVSNLVCFFFLNERS